MNTRDFGNTAIHMNTHRVTQYAPPMDDIDVEDAILLSMAQGLVFYLFVAAIVVFLVLMAAKGLLPGSGDGCV